MLSIRLLSFFWCVLAGFWCAVVCEKSPLNPWESNAPEFHDPGLYHVNVGLSNMNAFVAAVGDFDSDRYVDVFLVSNDRSWMQVMSWLTSEYVFDTKGNIVFETGIVNVVPVDVNHDGEMDVVIMTKNETGTYMHFYLADHSDLSKHSANGPFEGQPLVLDIDGDLEVEFLGVLKGEQERKVWKFHGENGLIDIKLPSGIAQDGSLADPHGAATVDLNGDCVADLVLFSKEVPTRGTTDTTAEERIVAEMYVRHGSKSYALSQKVTLPLGAGVPSFDDMDGDGNVDLVFPVCYPLGTCTQERSIHIIFNQQHGMCRTSTSHGCRDPDNLCKSASFSFESSFPTEDHLVIDLGSWKPLAVPSMEDIFPPRVRFGDLNLDGHPDALIVLKSDDGDYHSVFFMNVKHGSRRSLQRRESGHYEEIFSIPNAVSASFIDLDETGTLDIIVNQLGSSKGMMQMSVLFNNLFFDAFFLKSLALNGICASWCSDGSKFPQPKPYGVNLPGPVTKFTVTDLHGDLRCVTGVQLPQSSYSPLASAFLHFGLGRTNNYIKDYFVGLPTGESRRWMSIIPNSRLVCIPYPMDQPEAWQLELFISPSAIIMWVVVTLGLLLFVLSIPVFIYRRREKREDEEEKRKHAHIFNFRAL